MCLLQNPTSERQLLIVQQSETQSLTLITDILTKQYNKNIQADGKYTCFLDF